MEYASSVQAVALRVVTLDTDGTPLIGEDSAFVTDHFTQVSWTPQYKTGTEFTQDAANGKECVYYKMPDTLQKVNVNVSICNPQPELYEKLGGGTVLQGAILRTISNKALASNVATLTSNAHGFQIGDTVTVRGVDGTFDGTFVVTGQTANTFSFARTAADVASTASTGVTAGPDHTQGVVGYAAPTKDEIPNEYGIGLEVWSRRIIESRPAGYWRWVFPFTNFRMEGERSLGNGILANSFAGESIANTAFGTGPANDWLYGGSSAMQFAMDTSAPTGVNDYFEVEAAA
jgi:hypothetical protein